jgi:hypothetical protein
MKRILPRTASHGRTRARLANLDADHLTNPNLFLSDVVDDLAARGRKIVRTTVLKLSSAAPDQFGVANIAFRQGKGAPPTGGPNAVTQNVTTTFWIDEMMARCNYNTHSACCSISTL